MANYVILPEHEERYACPGCGESFSEVGQARRCCTSAYDGFCCDGCGAHYGEENEAAACCPQISEAWACCECGNTFSDEDEASDCCAPDEDDIEGGRYMCVVDEMVWPTEEAARECCSWCDLHGEAVDSLDMHGKQCKCHNCERKRKENPNGTTATAVALATVATATATTMTVEFSTEVAKPEEVWPPIEAPTKLSAFSS